MVLKYPPGKYVTALAHMLNNLLLDLGQCWNLRKLYHVLGARHCQSFLCWHLIPEILFICQYSAQRVLQLSQEHTA